MAKIREIKRRIKSVESTRQVTKTMEMVAASKIRKAQVAIESSRPYAIKLKELLANLVEATEELQVKHPLLAKREVRHKMIVAVTADRGLCGGFNSGILRRVVTEKREAEAQGIEVRVVAVGRKGLNYLRYLGMPVEKSFIGFSDNPPIQAASAISEYVSELYKNKEIDSVQLIFNHFYSAINQQVALLEALPISSDEPKEKKAHVEYIWEPSPEEVFSRALPAYLEATCYRALLESAASEHAARRRAMKSASDNAQEMINLLRRYYNRARQALITQEISEIVGGAESLKEE